MPKTRNYSISNRSTKQIQYAAPRRHGQTKRSMQHACLLDSSGQTTCYSTFASSDSPTRTFLSNAVFISALLLPPYNVNLLSSYIFLISKHDVRRRRSILFDSFSIAPKYRYARPKSHALLSPRRFSSSKLTTILSSKSGSPRLIHDHRVLHTPQGKIRLGPSSRETFSGQRGDPTI